jgi:hypothetical protein
VPTGLRAHTHPGLRRFSAAGRRLRQKQRAAPPSQAQPPVFEKHALARRHALPLNGCFSLPQRLLYNATFRLRKRVEDLPKTLGMLRNITKKVS